MPGTLAIPAALVAAVLATAPAGAPSPAGAQSKERVTHFDVAALARFVALIGDTRRLSQPLGYGFAFNLGIYPWQRARTHLGFFFFAGHARAPELLRLPSGENPMGPTTPRWQRVGHTDFAGGLALRSDFDRVYWGAQLGAGLAISEFARPTEARASGDERFDGFDPTVRARVSLGIPLGDRHGIVLGLALTKIFSGVTVPLLAGASRADDDPRPFDLITEFDVGYQGRF